jgi:hypothetical protein
LLGATEIDASSAYKDVLKMVHLPLILLKRSCLWQTQ